MTKNINTTKYAILDYDGYVCKAFYANKENPMDIQTAEEILKDLEFAAVSKAINYFDVDYKDLRIIKLMSGHSWKKDIYPSYKRTRKRDEYLGVFRDYIKSNDKDIIIPDCLEADEAIVCLADYLRNYHEDFIVFSDDKDLRYYSEVYCKINITEEVHEQDILSVWKYQLEQMIIGDREDNITGIPKVGEKTAPKILDTYGYDISGVIKCFKDKNIDIDNCLRDLLLIIPLSEDYLEDKNTSRNIAKSILQNKIVDNYDTYEAIISQIKFLNNKVKEVYNEA